MKNISIEGWIEDINSKGFRRIEDPVGMCIIMYSRYIHVVYILKFHFVLYFKIIQDGSLIS